MPRPLIVFLAGPDGAGKTTVSKFLLPDVFHVHEFVNADRIASGLSGFAPDAVAFEAGSIMLRRIAQLLKDGTSFSFETSLASKSVLKLVKQAQDKG